MHDPVQLLIFYALLGFFAGFIVTLIGGGGGLVMISGLSFVFAGIFSSSVALKLAIGTSIALFPVIAVSALWALSKQGLGWDYRYFVRALPFIVVGACIGPSLTMALPATILHPVIGALLLMYGVYQLIKKGETGLREQAEPITARITLIVCSVSFVAAIIAGAAGVAIGVFLIPCLALYLPYRQAISTSISAAIPSTVIGALSYAFLADDVQLGEHWHQGYVYLPAFFAMLSTTIFGAVAGGKITVRLPVNWIRNGFYLYVSVAGAAIGLG